MRGAFTTTLLWHDSRGGEVETDARVLYSYSKGYPATWEDPGADAEVEIIKITASDPSITIPESFYTDDELIAECFEDWRAEEESAAEWRAQARRDDALMDAMLAAKAGKGGAA